jgi:hypothetical protein
MGGLCGVCRRARLVRSAKGGIFVRCTHPDLPRYLGQPVLRCLGFGEREKEDDTE